MSALSNPFEFLDFFQCLNFANVIGEYSVILKPKQVLCLEAVYRGKDLLAVLPTGYGKSLIFHLIPSLLAEKKRRSGLSAQKTVVIVVFPLNSLIHDQLQKINRIRTRAAVLTAGEQGLDLSLVDETRLKNADYEFVFTHPETCLSSREGVSLFQSHSYQSFVSAVIVDEAHCILEWLVRFLNYLQTSDFNCMLHVNLLKFC